MDSMFVLKQAVSLCNTTYPPDSDVFPSQWAAFRKLILIGILQFVLRVDTAGPCIIYYPR